jgi:hypothetical protein
LKNRNIEQNNFINTSQGLKAPFSIIFWFYRELCGETYNYFYCLKYLNKSVKNFYFHTWKFINFYVILHLDFLEIKNWNKLLKKTKFAQIFNHKKLKIKIMYWTLELASKLEDAPWPAKKDELIDYAMRSGAPLEVIENLQSIEDDGDIYNNIESIWPDYPSKEDFFFNEDEY